MSAYSDAIDAHNPVAYWRLGETTGINAADETTNHDGTYVNTPTLDQPSLIGTDAVNPAVGFAGGSNEHVSVADASPLDGAASWTLIAWIKYTSTQAVSYLAGKQVLSGSYKGYKIYLNNDEVWWYTRDAATTQIKAAGALNDGVPHMIVATLGGGTGKIYVDGGAAKSSASMQTPGANAVPFYIATSGTLYAFTGDVDEVVLIPSELSQAQIQTLYDLAINVLTTSYDCEGHTLTFYYDRFTMKLLKASCGSVPSGRKVSFTADENGGSTWTDAFTASGEKVCPYDMEYTSDGEGGISNIDIEVQVERL